MTAWQPLGCRAVSELDQAVRAVVRDCLAVREGEDVLVVCNPATLGLGERLRVEWQIDQMPRDALVPPLVPLARPATCSIAWPAPFRMRCARGTWSISSAMAASTHFWAETAMTLSKAAPARRLRVAATARWVGPRADLDFDPQFLPQLTPQTLLEGFPRLALASREFPQPCQVPAFRPPGNQELPLAEDKSGTDLDHIHRGIN